MDEKELIEFAKWFVHSRRKNLKYEDKLNAVSFASNLMVELCANHPFEEHRLIAEFKEAKEKGEL